MSNADIHIDTKHKHKTGKKDPFNPRLLIQEVHARPLLWNRQDELYNDQDALDHIWTEIAESLGVSKEKARRKWKGLRDTFFKELRKPKNIKKNSKNSKTQWKHLSSLMFLKNHFSGRKSSKSYMSISTVKSEESDSDYLPANECFNAEVFPEIELANFPKEDPLENQETGSTSKPVLSELIQAYQKELIDLEKTKMSIITSLHQDDDMLFFQSLLPYVKTLDTFKKLILRTKIHDMICEYIYGNQNNQNGDS